MFNLYNVFTAGGWIPKLIYFDMKIANREEGKQKRGIHLFMMAREYFIFIKIIIKMQLGR